MEKIIKFLKDYQSDIIIVIAVALMTYIGYNVGKITAFNSMKTPITVTNSNSAADIVRPDGGIATTTPNTVKTDVSVVASKKSTSKLYHFKWCPGAAQISPANLLTFPTEAAAIAAGYTLASNCNR
ncbi:MAG: hypothetical protein ABR875_02760 [Minisyncoccia bacterium]|jgi:hypothetical protein